jgi:uncharacterized membrane protein
MAAAAELAAQRLQSVDFYRGLAILAMAAYHACWDLNYYGLIEAGIGVDPLWMTAQRSILTAFLLLAGAGLALGHANGIIWRAFWRREAVLVAAALAVTLGTWFLFGAYFAYFGVLHAIALFSLMALPFIRAPLWIGGLVAAVFLLLPAVYSSDVFNTRWLDWIGFFRTTPETADLVPVFPWFGVLLIGVLGMRVLRGAPAFGWSSRNRGVRALAFLGRWSLIVYLVHQPLLFAAITPVANYLQTAQQAKLTSFTESCNASCGVNNEAKFCTAYCGCALDMTVRDNLWDKPASELGQMSALCTAMAR